ncbi:ABC transporter permease [Desulfonema magnum]|uniref:Permease, MacB-like domain-containing n=1 Tax=Desulfonema magnum TaxID=45655 RepID=A0A975BTI0_9BACT|nr:FtsX-like permease family protein [Desulfonema magnum]QTA91400.1 Permease, MacB-like domain-containing [Desulfonema magnum]
MSIDIKMAWRNIWRNPRRTLLTISAIAFASLLLVFMLSFQFGSYETMINAAVKIQTGHFQIQAEGYREKRSIRQVVSDPASAGKILDKIPEIAAYTFRAEAFSLVSSENRTYGAMVVGVDPVREAGVSTLKELIREGSYFSDNDTAHALVGRLLAKNLQAGIGDELILLGQGRDGSVAATVVTVRGIYSSGQDEFDRSAIHIPLKYFQDIYTMNGAVHEVIAVGRSLENVSEIKADVVAHIKKSAIKSSLVVLDWEELMPGLRQAISMDLISGLIFWFLLIIIVAFSILNTFLMAIFERTREFGVMMAIGTTPGRLTKLLLIESVFMTLLGVISGIFLGGLLTWYFQIHGIDFGSANELLSQYGISGRMYPKLSLLSALLGPGMVLFITFLAALYPAFKVRKLRPVEAMSYT